MALKLRTNLLGALMVCSLSIADEAAFTFRSHPANLPFSPQEWARRLEPYESARPAGFVGWAPQGMIISRRVGDLPQLFHLRTPDGIPLQLSHFTDRVDRIYANPDPAKPLLLLTRDSGGDEQYRLYLHHWDTHRETPWLASVKPGGRVASVLWNQNGTRFAYSHTPAGSADWDVHVGSLPQKDRLVLHRPGAWSPLDFSPDGKSLLLQRDISAAESELWILNLSDTSLTQILPREKPQAYTEAVFLPPEKGRQTIAFVSDREGEFQKLYRYLEGEASPQVLSPDSNADVEWMMPQRDRRELMYALNVNGSSRIYRSDLSNPAHYTMPVFNLAKGIIWPGMSAPDGSMAIMLSGISSPGDVYSMDKKGKTLIWAKADSVPADNHPVQIREAWFPTFDSINGEVRKIPAWVHLPSHPSSTPSPVLIQIHGGPELQSRPGYDPFIRFCVQELGLAVVQPNVRGSTGYGKTWQQLDNGRNRMNTVRDIGALLDWIQQQPEFDAKKIALMGRSYGGFMVQSALVQYGDRLRAGISGVGISHFPSFLEHTAAYRQDLRRVEYGDERDPAMRAFLDSISPLTQSAKIHTPLLLIHGRNDPRVPLEQSERMFTALEKSPAENGIFILEGVGHGIPLKSREILYHAASLQFLTRHLDSALGK